MSYMIFHVPYFVDKNRKSGSHIRPFKLLAAFESIGYQVDVVMGYGAERKKAIDQIKAQIAQGRVYDFCYSESSTMPTLLTEANHLPSYPTLDFGFFRFLKQNQIPIGLFYRDCYWLFDDQRTDVSAFKRWVSNVFYRYDLKLYPKLVDVFYLPTTLMMDYIPMPFSGPVIGLPPGAEVQISDQVSIPSSQSESLRLFYVGGLSDLYDMQLIFKVVSDLPFLEMTVCCRQEEWEAERPKYEAYLNDRIQIIHKSGLEFKEDIEQAHLSLLYFKPHKYRKFAMPVKLFEYMSYKKPVVSVDQTAVGEFVDKYQVGWKIPYDEAELKSFFKDLNENRARIDSAVDQMTLALEANTWQARARQVVKDLRRRP